MSDREFLELAAKAAGMEPPFDALGGLRAWVGSPEGGHWWEPLNDDGDALRLAVKLGIEICPDAEDHSTQTAFMVGNCGYNTYEEWGQFRDGRDDDPMRATRRAIVRAAAEIGRAMP